MKGAAREEAAREKEAPRREERQSRRSIEGKEGGEKGC